MGICVTSAFLASAFSVVVPVAAITLWPFVVFRREPDEVTLRHEQIHLLQQAELFVVGFYLLYVYGWISGLARSSAVDSYMASNFEREAYLFEADEGYIARRPRFAWMKLPAP
jgi:hypothetical protein